MDLTDIQKWYFASVKLLPRLLLTILRSCSYFLLFFSLVYSQVFIELMFYPQDKHANGNAQVQHATLASIARLAVWVRFVWDMGLRCQTQSAPWQTTYAHLWRFLSQDLYRRITSDHTNTLQTDHFKNAPRSEWCSKPRPPWARYDSKGNEIDELKHPAESSTEYEPRIFAHEVYRTTPDILNYKSLPFSCLYHTASHLRVEPSCFVRFIGTQRTGVVQNEEPPHEAFISPRVWQACGI